MAAITVNSLNINDATNYTVTEVTYRHTAARDVQTAGISRNPGDKLVATEWKNKEITIKGYVFGSSPTTLRTLVDALHQNFAVQSLSLAIDTDRTYTATMTDLKVPTQFYNNSYVEYEAKFLAVDPFAYASQVTASGTVASGTSSVTSTITISGTVFAGPILSIYPKGANAGNSGIRAIKITHVPTGETITVSGTFNYNAAVSIDYMNFLVTNSGVASDYTGIFSRWQPGSVSFTIATISGVSNGYNYRFSYSPRYYQ